MIFAGLVSLGPAFVAHGAPEIQATSSTRAMLLVVAAEPSETESLRQVAAELLGRLAVAVRAERVGRIDLDEIARPASLAPQYLARVFVDLREPRRVTLWFVDPAHDRILVRQLDRSPGGDEVMREELGHILETSTEGLLSGAEIGLPRAKVMAVSRPTPDRPSPAPPRLEPTGGRSLQFALFYEAQALSSQAFVTHGPGASVWFALPLQQPALGVWLTGQYRFPVRLEASAVGARIEGGALRAMVTFDAPLGARFTLRSFLGGGVDIVHLEPQASGATGVTLADARQLAFAALRAGLGVGFRAARTLSIGARAGVDVDLSAARYVYAGLGGDTVLMQAFPIRPAVAVEIGVP
jgi:hypothetical protein